MYLFSHPAAISNDKYEKQCAEEPFPFVRNSGEIQPSGEVLEGRGLPQGHDYIWVSAGETAAEQPLCMVMVAPLTGEVQATEEDRAVDTRWVIVNTSFVRALRLLKIADEIVVSIGKPAL